MDRVRRLELDNVRQVFPGRSGSHTVAVDGVSMQLSADGPRIVNLVGASGSGKSTAARIMLGLQQPTSGEVSYCGTPLRRLGRAERRLFRRDVQPVFQDPFSIFNPIYRVDRIFWKAIRRFGLASDRSAGLRRIHESLEAVQLAPDEVLGRFAHQLSGGQRQRLMLARIHLLRPAFVIADEPVSMLDAQVRKSFLDLLCNFGDDLGITTLMITHDLSTVAYLGGDVHVMLRGRIVESGTVESVLTQPRHDYTKQLLSSVPIPDPDQRWTDRVTLPTDLP